MITIDASSTKPIYEQIYEEFVRLIFLNVLLENEKIPSVRELALLLQINPNTIQKSYKLLEKNKFIKSVKGKGNFVNYNEEAQNIYKNKIQKKLLKIVNELVDIGVNKNEIISLVKESVNNA